MLLMLCCPHHGSGLAVDTGLREHADTLTRGVQVCVHRDAAIAIAQAAQPVTCKLTFGATILQMPTLATSFSIDSM